MLRTRMVHFSEIYIETTQNADISKKARNTRVQAGDRCS